MHSKIMIAGCAVLALMWACSHDFENPYDSEYNGQPNVIVTWAPEPITINTDITFDGNDSFDPDNDALEFRLVRDMGGDNNIVELVDWTSDPVIIHRFTESGDYNIRFEVMDAKGAIAWQEHGFSLDATPPFAVFTVNPQLGTKDSEIVFNAGSSHDIETDVSNLQFSWRIIEIGKGTLQNWTAYSSAQIFRQTFALGGLKEVWLRVKDEADNVAAAMVNVPVELPTVNNLPFAGFTVNPKRGTTSTSFNVDASICEDHDLETLQYAWDWNGDGNEDTGWDSSPTQSHSFMTSGLKTIGLLVRDGNAMNFTSQASLQVQVN